MITNIYSLSYYESHIMPTPTPTPGQPNNEIWYISYNNITDYPEVNYPIGYNENVTNLVHVVSNTYNKTTGYCIIKCDKDIIGIRTDNESSCSGIFDPISSDITNISIPESVQVLYAHAFNGHRCKTFTIPKNINTIYTGAIITGGLAITLICEPIVPPQLYDSNFPTTPIAIYVPAESVDAYKTAPEWSQYADKIQPMPTE